jgi:hypothetical protein
MSSPKETSTQRSLRVISQNTDAFAERNEENRDRAADILDEILKKNTDKYNLTEAEIEDIVDYYRNGDDPTSIYKKFFPTKRIPEHTFFAMISETNVRSRNEVKEEERRWFNLTPAQKKAEKLAVKAAAAAKQAFMDKIMKEEQQKTRHREQSYGLGVGTKKRGKKRGKKGGKKSKRRIGRS